MAEVEAQTSDGDRPAEEPASADSTLCSATFASCSLEELEPPDSPDRETGEAAVAPEFCSPLLRAADADGEEAAGGSQAPAPNAADTLPVDSDLFAKYAGAALPFPPFAFAGPAVPFPGVAPFPTAGTRAAPDCSAAAILDSVRAASEPVPDPLLAFFAAADRSEALARLPSPGRAPALAPGSRKRTIIFDLDAVAGADDDDDLFA
jgi:hypothetical protein